MSISVMLNKEASFRRIYMYIYTHTHTYIQSICYIGMYMLHMYVDIYLYLPFSRKTKNMFRIYVCVIKLF